MLLMLVWLHYAGEPLPPARVEELSAEWAEQAVAFVAPSADYDPKNRDLTPRENAESALAWVQAAVSSARLTHGDLPTVYAGVSYGGWLAVYAAQRDRHAVRSITLVPCMIDRLDARFEEYWRPPRRTADRLLAERAASAPPSVWFIGAKDRFCGRDLVLRAFAGYQHGGGTVEVRELDVGHRSLARMPWRAEVAAVVEALPRE